jgi:hypothetical protein
MQSKFFVKDILSINAEMPVVPNGDCLEIEDFVKKLEGMEIKPGFTNVVRNLLGNVQGCIRVTNLIQVSASSAVRGMDLFQQIKQWSKRENTNH